MAVERLPAVTTPPEVRPVRAARTAQHAFFEAALGRVQAGASPKVTPLNEIAEPGKAAPARPLRPGSLLDIKV